MIRITRTTNTKLKVMDKAKTIAGEIQQLSLPERDQYITKPL
jgi:hypothetical protein